VKSSCTPPESGTQGTESKGGPKAPDVQFTSENIIHYDEVECPANDTGHFGSENEFHNSVASDQHDSAYFTRDPTVIKHASYGDIKECEKIENQLKLQVLSSENEENNQQSFADDNEQSSRAKNSLDIHENSDMMY
jgi:hypothetical protein